MYNRGLAQPHFISKLNVFITVLVLLFAGVASLIPLGVQGQDSDETPAPYSAHITSRFILWDQYEKMIDNNITVHIVTLTNDTIPYTININGDLIAGNVTYYTARQVNLTAEVISITVTINGTTVFTGYDVIVMRDVTGGQIKRGRSAFTINLLPSEWSKREWSIFTAMVTALIVILPITYRAVKTGRKVRGVREIK